MARYWEKPLHGYGKYDYDSDDFYKILEKYASVCFYDKDLAALLEIDYEKFVTMIQGNCPDWTDEQNERRGTRIRKLLQSARAKTVLKARNTLLRIGNGNVTIKSRSIKRAVIRCHCKGKKHDCPTCGGVGWMDSNEEAVLQENEQEIAPNLSALMTWLRHHDPNYRKAERGEYVDSEMSEEIQKGIDMKTWIEKELHEQRIIAEKPQIAEKPDML